MIFVVYDLIDFKSNQDYYWHLFSICNCISTRWRKKYENPSETLCLSIRIWSTIGFACQSSNSNMIIINKFKNKPRKKNLHFHDPKTETQIKYKHHLVIYLVFDAQILLRLQISTVNSFFILINRKSKHFPLYYYYYGFLCAMF